MVEGLEGRCLLAATITEFPLPTANFMAADITKGPDGNLWFTEDALGATGTSLQGKIGRITPAGAITEFPLPAGSAAFAITTGPDGNLWFTEGALGAIGTSVQSKIGRITTAGVVTEFPLPSAQNVALLITAGPDGNLWFTEDNVNSIGSGGPATGTIGRITPAGAVTEFPLPTAQSFALAITAGPDGNLWFTGANGTNVSVSATGLIGRITTAGALTEFPLPAGSLALVITKGPDGNLWFTTRATSAGQDTIGRITTAGALTEFPLPAGSTASSITAGPDGNLWFPEATAAGAKIGQITPAGTVTEFPLTTQNTLSSITVGPDGNFWVTENSAAGSGLIGRITITSSPSTTPPIIVGLSRRGFHLQPTRIVLTFSGPLDPTRAQNRNNYRLTTTGPRGKSGPRIVLRSATYDPTAQTVTLSPGRLLNLHQRFRLQVNGNPPNGLTSSSGVLLDGNRDGQPGGNFVTTFQGLVSTTF